VQGTCKYGTGVDYILASPNSSYKLVPGSCTVIAAETSQDEQEGFKERNLGDEMIFFFHVRFGGCVEINWDAMISSVMFLGSVRNVSSYVSRYHVFEKHNLCSSVPMSVRTYVR
jgi:hypothetical protein